MLRARTTSSDTSTRPQYVPHDQFFPSPQCCLRTTVEGNNLTQQEKIAMLRPVVARVIPGCGHDCRDPCDHDARVLDALTEFCHRSQTAEVLPDRHGEAPRVTVTMDLDDLRVRTGFGVTETGEDPSASTVRRMCCDAEIIPPSSGPERRSSTSDASSAWDVGRVGGYPEPNLWWPRVRAWVAHWETCRASTARRRISERAPLSGGTRT